MSQRPSKRALYHYLKRDVRARPGGVGVDAASAHMKNYWMFKTDHYVGVDARLDALRVGVSNKPNAIGILADLAHLHLPENSVELCVSTNTFEHLSLENQLLMAGHLARIVKPDGALLFNKHRDAAWPAILELMRREFAQVELRYYRNYLSRGYESIFVPDEQEHAWRKPLVALLSGLELGTAFFPWFNEGVYVRCSRKHRRAPDQVWSLDGLEPLEAQLYRLPAQ